MQGLVLAAQVVRQLVERRMQVWTVEALAEVLDDELPVRRDVVRDAVTATKFAHSPRPELLWQVCQLLLQGRPGVGHADVEESIPHVGADAEQRKVLLPEVRRSIHVRRSDQ